MRRARGIEDFVADPGPQRAGQSQRAWMGRISSSVLRAHRHSAPFAFIERQRGGEAAERLDLRLQIRDLLLRGANGIGARDEAARRWLLARNGDERSRELRGVAGLPSILGFPELEHLRSALVIVAD